MVSRPITVTATCRNVTLPPCCKGRRSPRARRASFRPRDFNFSPPKKSVSFSAIPVVRNASFLRRGFTFSPKKPVSFSNGDQFGMKLKEADIGADIGFLLSSSAAVAKVAKVATKSSSPRKRKSTRLEEKNNLPVLRLSKKEVEEDLMFLAPGFEFEDLRRPQKKRRKENPLFPGLNLHLITADSYRVTT